MNSLDIDFDKPPKLIRKRLDDDGSGDDWTFAVRSTDRRDDLIIREVNGVLYICASVSIYVNVYSVDYIFIVHIL